MSIQQWTFYGCLALAARLAVQAQNAPVTPAAVNATAPAPVSLSQVLQASRQQLEVSLAQRVLAAARADVTSADHAPVPVLSREDEVELAS